jgi:hypothetical protein
MACGCSMLFWLMIPSWFVKFLIVVHMESLDYANGITRDNRKQSASHFPIAVNFKCDICS